MKIRFLEDRATKEARPQSFKKGKVYDLPDASAQHWLNRQVAVPVDEEEEQPQPLSDKEARAADKEAERKAAEREAAEKKATQERAAAEKEAAEKAATEKAAAEKAHGKGR